MPEQPGWSTDKADPERMTYFQQALDIRSQKIGSPRYLYSSLQT